MSAERGLRQIEHWRVEIGARVTALVLIFMVALLSGTLPDVWIPLVLLTLLAVAAVLPAQSSRIRRWRPAVEGAVAAFVIASVEPYDPSLLPYLVVPSLSAGLTAGWTLAVITAGGTAFVLMARGVLVSGGLSGTEYLVDATQWTLIALSLGLLAAWLRRVQTHRPTDEQSYVEASRLLIQLREVSRTLSGGLDVVSLATGLLEDLRDRKIADRGWVYGFPTGNLPVLLASDPPGEVPIDPDLTPGGMWARAIDRERALPLSGGFTADHTMHGAISPVRMNREVVAVVAAERRGRKWDRDSLAELQRLTDTVAVRIDAGMLFDEVRGIATTEERQRLAREIHDGVAQEVASLGYLIDDLSANAGPETQEQLRRLRTELSRVVTELRYSIFDLRREIGPGTSLTTALAEHARHVGESSGITVHLELSETPRRLSARIESELFRIAQEAMTNARKHARAKNLWVLCRVSAPEVWLCVEDDGRGIEASREGSFGLDIMAERAERAGCVLTVSPRTSGGTTVEVRTSSSNVAGRLSEREDV